MLKATVYLLLGAIPAAAATYYFAGDRMESSGLTPAEPGSAAPSGESRPVVGTSGTGNPLPLAYRAAAELADPVALEAELARAMAEPFSLTRNARVEALFKRLAEIDLQRALRIAQVPGFDRRLVAGVFRAWAQADRDAALRQLASVRDPETRIEVAVAMLEAFGDDAAAIERIAASLPEIQRIDFQAEALARRAESDPNSALTAALALRDPAARNTAAQRVGIAWTQRDPMAAIQRTETLPPELRTAYRDSVAIEWARTDVPGFLDYADSLPELEQLRAGLAQTMAVDPMRLFEIASRHPPVPIGPPFPQNITVDRTAFTAAVNADPQWGVEYLKTLVEDSRYNSFRAAIAETWGRIDPVPALEWAKSMDPPVPGILGTIVWSASMVDIDLSIDWMLDFENLTGLPSVPGNVPNNLGIFVAADPRRMELANRLRRQRDNPAATQLLSRVATLWVQSDPADLLDWMLEDPSSIDSAVVSSVAGQLANRDPEFAASYLERMPPELKGLWLEQVAAPFALADPAAAANWISQFRSEPNYESVMQQVVQMSALTNPESAARMLAVAPASIQANAAMSVASAWAQQDLASAGRWAAGLSDSSARSNAVSQVASAWAVRDPQAAQRWALSLPRGETRDRALQSLISRFSRPDFDVPIDSRLIEAFDSEQMRTMAEQLSEQRI